MKKSWEQRLKDPPPNRLTCLNIYIIYIFDFLGYELGHPTQDWYMFWLSDSWVETFTNEPLVLERGTTQGMSSSIPSGNDRI